MVIFAPQALYLAGNFEIFLLLLAPMFLSFVVNFLVSHIVTNLIYFPFRESVSFNFATLA
ncbi:MAG: hypothetical protein AMR96_05210 [Candidatus Adiutrix intracellularis]|nr:MAG: hypothetical protein AMR96_05210 [Candidatus Adiutrix intracellularis]